MYQTDRAERSHQRAGYVPYFYQPGLLHYLPPRENVLAILNYGPLDVYDFSSDLTGKTYFHHPPTVEQIVARGYFSVPRSDPVGAIISDKADMSWLGLDDLIGQIRHRYEVYQRNIYDLELAKCAAINSLFAHEARHGPADSKIEYSMNKRLDGVYAEQREERINLWRDVSRLRVLLPESAQNYLAAYRKVSILKDAKGDSP